MINNIRNCAYSSPFDFMIIALLIVTERAYKQQSVLPIPRTLLTNVRHAVCEYSIYHSLISFTDFLFRPRRSRSTAAYSHQTFPCTICRSVCLSVGRSVGRSVCPVHCGKTTDRIRQPSGTIGRTGPRMRQVLGFANRSTGKSTFGGEFGPHHCNQWGLYGVRVRQCLNRRRCGLG